MEAEVHEEKPNILVILLDDHGYGDLSLRNREDIQTPHIDALFGKGMQFTNFYSNCTVSSPTRASLLTGRYPDLVGVPGVIRPVTNNCWGYFDEAIPTLPEMLKRAGYQTSLIGKWHLGEESPNLPNERGFDLFKGFLSGMMDDYYTHFRAGKNCLQVNGKEVIAEGHATSVFSDWAIEYLNEAKQHQDPFFLYLAYNAPHFPIQPPEEWYRKVKEREPGLSEKRIKNIALVEHLDAEIGRVLKELEDLGLTDNTLIIFSSDNGGSLPHGVSNGKLKGGKHDLYEGGLKVNTCFVWEGKIKPQTECQQLSLTMDIFPTLCDVAGVSINHEIDGESVYPFLIEEKRPAHERTAYFMYRDGGEHAGLCTYAVRKGDIKFVLNSPYAPAELFNISSDPYEKHPLKEDEELLKEMRQSLSRHIQKSGSVPWQKDGVRDGGSRQR